MPSAPTSSSTIPTDFAHPSSDRPVWCILHGKRWTLAGPYTCRAAPIPMSPCPGVSQDPPYVSIVLFPGYERCACLTKAESAPKFKFAPVQFKSEWFAELDVAVRSTKAEQSTKNAPNSSSSCYFSSRLRLQLWCTTKAPVPKARIKQVHSLAGGQEKWVREDEEGADPRELSVYPVKAPSAKPR